MEDKEVFYCDTPCQIQALYKYLKKDYKKLNEWRYLIKEDEEAGIPLFWDEKSYQHWLAMVRSQRHQMH